MRPVSPGSQKVANLIKAVIKISKFIPFVLLPVLLPTQSFSGTTVKFRHILSIYSDDKGVSLKQPDSVACSEKSFYIVADTGNKRLLRYVFQNNILEAGVKKIKVPQLSYPIKTKINSKGDIFVLDGKKRRIIHLTPEGVFKGYIDPIGSPSPKKYVPRSFALDTADNIEC